MPKRNRHRSDIEASATTDNSIEKYITSLPINQELQTILLEWDSWMNGVKQFSEHTQAAYHNDIHNFILFFSHHKGENISKQHLTNIDIRDLRAWIVNRANNDYSKTSHARAMSSLRGLFRYLRNYYKLDNPHIFAFQVAKSQAPLPRALDQSEIFILIESYDSGIREEWVELRDKALLMLLYGCGLRISEALSLDYGIFQQASDNIRVLGKGKKQRDVPLLPIVKNAIIEYIAECPHSFATDSPVFYGVRGKRLSPPIFSKRLRELRHELGLPESLTPHAMRHSFATHLLAEDANLRDIQELLGHESLSATQRYTKVDINHLMTSYNQAHPKAEQD